MHLIKSKSFNQAHECKLYLSIVLLLAAAVEGVVVVFYLFQELEEKHCNTKTLWFKWNKS